MAARDLDCRSLPPPGIGISSFESFIARGTSSAYEHES